MRRAAAILALLLAAGASPLAAQSSPAPTPATVPTRAELTDHLRLLASEPGAPRLSVNDINAGRRVVAAGVTERGHAASAGGDLLVLGTVAGDAVAIDGDVVVKDSGVVRGNAWAVRGRVRVEGQGRVDGEMRALGGAVDVRRPAPAPLTPAAATRRALGISAGWLAVIAIIGIGVLLFATPYLEGVAEALEIDFARSFWVGLLGQLALLPALALLVIALAITILGLLLIPFAIVAYALAAAGVITLGFLAAAQVTGQSVLGRSAGVLTARGAALRALMLGVVLFMSLWLLAAAFTWFPLVGAVLRYVALIVTWVAATVGLGAVIRSRGGTRAAAPPAAADPVPPELSWQTPTPVTGVVAARRPTPAPPSSSGHR